MRIFLTSTVAVILSLCCLAGCNLGGPSKKEVAAALDDAMRAFTESVEEKTPEVENAHSNALDLIFINDDNSLIHHMNVLVSANGKDIDLSEQDSLYNLLRQISQQLPG